jgi:6-phosphogluconate dehydrogenase
MQLLAETYDLLRRGAGLSDDQLHDVYDRWNRNEAAGFLVEITANIFKQVDDRTGKRLVDVILDAAGQLGTGMWTSQNAMDLQVPVPTIDIAVAMRALSAQKAARVQEAKMLAEACVERGIDRDALLGQLERAFHAAMIVTYAQGMALLQTASRRYGYGFALAEVARIWRGGCIIRSALLEDIRAAYAARPDLENLIQDAGMARKVADRQADLRAVVRTAVDLGIPAAGFMSVLAYYDACRSAWLPANLIQAQRDYFGAHTYERIDSKGVFHTQWSEA